jgi:hypothetical protein
MSSKNGIFHLKRNIIFIVTLLLMTALLVNTIVTAEEINFSNHIPAKASTIKLSSTKISTYVKSLNGVELNDQTFSMTINGKPVQASFQYKGYLGYGGAYIITDRKEGTIYYDATSLQDGINTVVATINDKTGKELQTTWSFTVTSPPTISNITPTDKSEQKTVNSISAVIGDNTAINWDTVKLKLNNAYVTIDKNTENGTITYTTPLSSKTHIATIEAKDVAGNLTTKTWSFVVDSLPPNIVSSFINGQIITDGILKFSAQLNDLVDIKDNVTLKLGDQELDIDFKYPGKFDYYGDYIITSKKTATITYEGTVPNGNHTLYLYTEDKLGNYFTKSWNISVATKPTISNETPLKYGVDTLKPTISATVTSSNGAVDPATFVLKINNEVIEDFSYDSNTGLLSYTPSESLTNESYHTVNITVSDQTGLETIREWKFYINTYKDMSDSSSANCTTCHSSTTFLGSNGVLEDIHSPKLYFSGSHSRNRCENCHNYISYKAECVQCHDNYDTGEPYAPHGSTPTIKYNPKNTLPYFPIRVTENREMVDCIVCHQPGVTVKTDVGSRILNNHDIPELHKAPADESCTGCHARSLTREHVQDGRVDKQNNAITCDTCHRSTNPEVTKAIADKNTSCQSCHAGQIHENQHSDCSTCHINGKKPVLMPQ